MKITTGEDLSKSWELQSGDDPLCACQPNPTCGDQELQLEGVDSCQLMKTAVDLVARETAFVSYPQHVNELAAYVDSKGRPGGREYRRIAMQFSAKLLTNRSCQVLPPKVPGTLKDDLKQCLQTLLYDVTLSGNTFFARDEDGGWIPGQKRRNPLERMASDGVKVSQVVAILEAPLQRYLQCVKTEGTVALVDFIQTKPSDRMELIQGQIQAALAAARADQEEEGIAPHELEIKVLLVSNTILFLLFCGNCCLRSKMLKSCFCCCCCCFRGRGDARQSSPEHDSDSFNRNEVELLPKQEAVSDAPQNGGSSELGIPRHINDILQSSDGIPKPPTSEQMRHPEAFASLLQSSDGKPKPPTSEQMRYPEAIASFPTGDTSPAQRTVLGGVPEYLSQPHGRLKPPTSEQMRHLEAFTSLPEGDAPPARWQAQLDGIAESPKGARRLQRAATVQFDGNSSQNVPNWGNEPARRATQTDVPTWGNAPARRATQTDVPTWGMTPVRRATQNHIEYVQPGNQVWPQNALASSLDQAWPSNNPPPPAFDPSYPSNHWVAGNSPMPTLQHLRST